MSGLHGELAELVGLGERAADLIRSRLAHAPLGRTASPAAVRAELRGSLTDAGLGLDEAWRRFTDTVVPNTVGLDSERFLAFVPVSPSVAGVWMDAVVGAVNFSAESWLEAAGAVAAEQEVLDLLATAADLPAGSGGCFMSGGSIGNLSALAVAREQAGSARTVAIADTAHASVRNALHLLGLDWIVIDTGVDDRLTGDALRAACSGRSDVGIVVASGGSTNAGVVDDLAGIAQVTRSTGAWLHVDAAYGGAALLVPEQRYRFAGIEHADSIIIDPHKWLFAPAGSCALLYRRPQLAAAVHTQHGPYLDVLHDVGVGVDGAVDGAVDAWNPSDLGFQLTRRASGLPLWFAMALHGIDAHRTAIRHGIDLAQRFADAVDGCPSAELVMRPELGVVLFRRPGWAAGEWRRWAERTLADGVAFVAPTTWRAEPVGRVIFMHPRTPMSIIDELVSTLVIS